MMACRTAGRLGDGGTPGRPVRFFSPARSIRLGEAEVPEVSAGHTRHQRVAVQTGPAAALEVIEAEFLLHLLVGLPAARTIIEAWRVASNTCRPHTSHGGLTPNAFATRPK
ncbi:hypothetical protein HNR00_002110 [Methylorubrum rhodinum]|uniref:Integrase catalytic domain-containing protein n=1 Tax=Methylorubrum rhodinum TaxID=29428 RepID=A0A840ZHP4_9HYPH|nr:hypothetical protein [Methylorubrum rhodinum]